MSVRFSLQTFGLILGVLLFSAGQQAHAVTASLAAGRTQSRAEGTVPGEPFSTQMGWGGGLLLDVYTQLTPTLQLGRGFVRLAVPIPLDMGMQLGVLYFERKYAELDGAGVTLNAGMYQFPILLHFSFGQILTFGIGGYYGLNKNLDAPSGALSSDVTYISKKHEWGMLANARLNIFPKSLVGLFGDLRYSTSLTSVSDSGSLKFTDLHLMAGIRIGRM